MRKQLSNKLDIIFKKSFNDKYKFEDFSKIANKRRIFYF